MKKIVLFKSPVLTREGISPVVARLFSRSIVENIKPLTLVDGIACDIKGESDLKALEADPDVLAVEEDVPIYLRPYIKEEAVRSGLNRDLQTIPWGINHIGADQAWEKTRGDGIKVAVMDTGVDLTHPDLAGNIKGGYNFVNPREKPQDDQGHGTHVAGTIAAVDNGQGVIGAAPSTDIYAVKILDKNGSGNLSDIINGLQWCVYNRMQLVNMSIGTDKGNLSLKTAVKRAARSGLIMVAAAGNDGKNNSVDYPAAYPEVIAVGAVDFRDQLASFSSKGPEVTVVAPGVNIYSTALGKGYQKLSGTSMATPHVTGLLSLGLYLSPKISFNQLTNMLKNSSQSITQLTAEEQGYGLVDARQMVSLLTQ